MRARLLHWEDLFVNDNNWLFVGAAFGLTWLVLIGYVMRIRAATRHAQALLDASAEVSR